MVFQTVGSLFKTPVSTLACSSKRIEQSYSFMYSLVNFQPTKMENPFWNPWSKETQAAQMSDRSSVSSHKFQCTDHHRCYAGQVSWLTHRL
jgi:hypothetical protein